jgi:hypothetical protein
LIFLPMSCRASRKRARLRSEQFGAQQERAGRVSVVLCRRQLESQGDPGRPLAVEALDSHFIGSLHL